MDELRRAHAAAREAAGVAPERVSITFDMFGERPLFTITTLRPQGGRKRDREDCGMGETLDEALVELRKRLAVEL